MAIMSNHVDIHPAQRYPAVDVSPQLSKPLPTSAGDARSEALSLLELTKQIDEELSFHQSTLSANGVGQKSALVDANGFPLADKDLVAIRSARNRIAMLHNDSKAVRERIEKLLQLAINGNPASASSVATAAGKAGTAAATSGASSEAEHLEPFARINSVAAASPAAQAGLQADDVVIRFASIVKANNDNLKALARPGVVTEGQELEVTVLRRNLTSASQDTVSLRLVPSSGWDGRGLLGCHIVPL